MGSFRLHIQAALWPRSTKLPGQCWPFFVYSVCSRCTLGTPTTSQDPNTWMLDYMCCPYNRLVHQIMLKISYNTDYNN